MTKIIPLKKFVTPEIVFGQGAIDLVSQYVLNMGCSKPFIASDTGVEKAGWLAKVTKKLEEKSISYVTYTNITPNPRDFEVMEGAEVFLSNSCDCIVAIGGGSVIDCAKGVGVVCTNAKNIRHFEGVDKIEISIPPIICIPTTGGTSADVSQFSIILNTEEKNKMAIISKAIVPDLALIDPQTLTTMDSYLTACTGIDALVHAFEAFVSKGASDLTDLYALKAIEHISEFLIKTIEQPKNIEYRAKVMLGSLEAGLAFSNASLGNVHAMAHSLGGLLDLPHGECNAMLLRQVVDYNFDFAENRYKQILKTIGKKLKNKTTKEAKKELLEWILNLKKTSGVLHTLSQKGVTKGIIPSIAAKAINDPCVITNPRKTSKQDIEIIYEESL